MSLYKQLWLAVAVLMLTVFGITFVINASSSSAYLEEQLSVKNSDNAQALALSLSQQALDPVALEIQLSAQLDLADYEWIELRSIEGETLFSRVNEPPQTKVPEWFKQLFDIQAIPGSAKVSNGWNQLGTLSIKSFEDFAYDDLWAGAQRTLIALVIAIVCAGVVGTVLLRLILAPLQQVVDQAKAIGERRFLTVEEPRTTEFAEVTRSMNELSRRVKEMLNREAQRLERQREASEIDRVSGLMVRRPLLARLRTHLDSNGSDASGCVGLLRINDLLRLNQTYGRQTMDTVIRDIGNELKHLLTPDDDWSVGRLNGSDYCIIAPHERDPKALGEQMQRAITDVLRKYEIQDKTTLPTSCIEYASGDTLPEIMTALDGALLSANQQHGSPVTVASRRSTSTVPLREQSTRWQRKLTEALAQRRLQLEVYPVLDSRGELLHQEGVVRFNLDGESVRAGEFMPWVYRLDMSGEVDRAVVVRALEEIKTSGLPLHIHLSSSSLTDLTFSIWLEERLLEYSTQAPLLSLEVAEAVAYSHPDGFHRLLQHAHPHGTSLGIEHMGYRISDIGKLSEMGTDFLKIDALFIREIDRNPGNQALCRTYVSIAQSLGVPCIAEGVQNTGELQTVIDLGCSGLTGPGVHLLSGGDD
ncbi:MAG: EAL domain-containing protein [Halieaceae bacterium]|jgi:EAL domain-containing protein (putative c-di-GMP-specific phosphodiesterase class I)/GGDEF domain-containing protein|nr:EAL domain-containing protein [Halieaceae bacterium]